MLLPPQLYLLRRYSLQRKLLQRKLLQRRWRRSLGKTTRRTLKARVMMKGRLEKRAPLTIGSGEAEREKKDVPRNDEDGARWEASLRSSWASPD